MVANFMATTPTFESTFEKLLGVIEAIQQIREEADKIARAIQEKVNHPNNATNTGKRSRLQYRAEDNENPPKRTCPLRPDNTFLCLPLPLLEKVLAFLDPLSVITFSTLCKYTRTISFTNRIWESIQRSRLSSFSIPLPRNPDEHSFEYYKRRIIVKKNQIKGKYVPSSVIPQENTVQICVTPSDPFNLYSASKSGVSLWDLTKEPVFVHTIRANHCKTFHVAKSNVFLADIEGIHVYHGPTAKLLYHSKGLLSQVNCITTCDSRLVLGMWDGFIQVHNVNDGCQISKIGGHKYRVNSLSMHNNIIASASSDKLVKLWNAESSRGISTLRGHTKMVHIVKLEPKSQNHVISGSKDGTVRLWDLQSDRKAHRVLNTGASVNTLDHNYEFHLVTGDDCGLVRMWDLRIPTDSCNVLTLTGPIAKPIQSVHFDEWRIMAVAGTKRILTWDFRVPEQSL